MLYLEDFVSKKNPASGAQESESKVFDALCLRVPFPGLQPPMKWQVLDWNETWQPIFIKNINVEIEKDGGNAEVEDWLVLVIGC